MFVAVRLKNAVEVYKTYGKGDSNYSISTFYQNNNVTSVDTNWHFSNEEDMRALQTLYDTLMHLKPLSILLPDESAFTRLVLNTPKPCAYRYIWTYRYRRNMALG